MDFRLKSCSSIKCSKIDETPEPLSIQNKQLAEHVAWAVKMYTLGLGRNFVWRHYPKPEPPFEIWELVFRISFKVEKDSKSSSGSILSCKFYRLMIVHESGIEKA